MVKRTWKKVYDILLLNAPLTLVIVVLILAAALVFVVPNILVQSDLVPDGAKRVELRQKERAALLQSLTGLLILVGAYVGWRQLQTNREGQVTERFSRVVEQLGHERRSVRLGGIHALEALVKEPSVDRSAVVEILSAYIREHSPWPPRATGETDGVDVDATPSLAELYRVLPLPTRAADVHDALRVLLRIMPEGYARLNLSSTDLRKVTLRNADFRDAALWMSNLQLTDLRGADLRRANLTGARLEWAVVDGADFSEADLGEGDICTRLEKAVANSATWPDGFDPEAAGVISIQEMMETKVELRIKDDPGS